MSFFRRSDRFAKPPRQPDWREYQRRLQRRSRRRGLRLLLVGLLLLLAVVAAVASSVRRGGGRDRSPVAERGEAKLATDGDKASVRALIKPADLFNRSSGRFTVDGHGRSLVVETTLDMDLQHSLVEDLDTRTALFIAVVAVAPDTGRILAMAGYDREGLSDNPCLDSRFPAASLFKIVTAAAAVQEADLNGASELSFNGGRYTLYRSQIEDKVTRYTIRIPLRDAFAGSINPVFGKLGALRLGKAALIRWAEAFGFNRPLPFEASLKPSRFKASEDTYHLAELASGFNRQTTLSPLHAALIAAAAVNAGRLYEPSAVARVVDARGRVYYRGHPRLLGEPMEVRTANEIAAMMEASVRKGTCRKPFLGAAKHPVLRHVTIGGKSGSIDNLNHSARIDWFAGWATERDGEAEIAVAAVVVHEKYIGTRAGAYARQVMTDYFGKCFSARARGAAAEGRG